MLILIIFLGITASETFTDSRIATNAIDKVNNYFNPMYIKIANFTELESTWKQQIEDTKEGLAKVKADTLRGLEDSVHAIIYELNFIKEEITPEKVVRILESLEHKITTISQTYNTEIQDSLGNLQSATLQNVAALGDSLKKTLESFQEKVVGAIEASNTDWIDIYTYFDNHHHTVQIRFINDDHRLSRWPILVFLLSAIFCLAGSTLFHLFYCLSPTVNKIFLRLDYAGICILIYGSGFPPVVYGFYCQPDFALLYLTITGIVSGTVFTVSMMDFIHTEKYRKMKSLMYGSLGIFSAFPIIHLMNNSFQVGLENDYLPFSDSLPYYIAMGGTYLGGLVIYTARCPERYKPRQFDICGQSHQLWHVCVVVAVVLHYLGAFENYYTRIDIPCIIV